MQITINMKVPMISRKGGKSGVPGLGGNLGGNVEGTGLAPWLCNFISK